ncbi:MAG: HlyD family efflux transporter periplasmic adaptor subunit [Pirellulaceae bacterium]
MMGTTLFGLLSKACKYLWFSKEIAHRRPYAIAYSVVLLAAGPAILLVAPVPGQVEAVGLVASEQEQIVRLETGVTVDALWVSPGDSVQPGMRLVSLVNDELTDSLRLKESELGKARMELRAIGKNDPVEATKLRCQIEYLSEQVADAQAQLAELEVSAVQTGRIVQSVPVQVRNAYVPAGEPICTVGAGKWQVRAIVNASDLADSRPNIGQTVECKFPAMAGRTIAGRLVKLSPSGSNLVEMPALTQLGGGAIAVDPTTMMAQEPFFELLIEFDEQQATDFLAHGMVANVRFQRGYESVGWFLYRQVLRFKNNLMLG